MCSLSVTFRLRGFRNKSLGFGGLGFGNKGLEVKALGVEGLGLLIVKLPHGPVAC